MLYFGKTDIGKKRLGNQDSLGTYKIAENALLCAVCDGMGGANGGGEASRLALEAFYGNIAEACAPKIQYGVLDTSSLDLALILDNAAEAANACVFNAASMNKELEGMGTTLVALFVADGKVFSVNVGDSRIYKIGESEILQITHDHSYVQYLVDMGKLSPEEAKSSINRNIITRAIGVHTRIEADINAVDTHSESGDTYFLLCSDGLTNMVSDDEIADIIRSSMSLEEKADALISAANSKGGTDNITVVILKL